MSAREGGTKLRTKTNFSYLHSSRLVPFAFVRSFATVASPPLPPLSIERHMLSDEL